MLVRPPVRRVPVTREIRGRCPSASEPGEDAMARNAIVDVQRSGPNLPFEVHAYQSFVVGLKLYWTRSIYEHVADEAKALALDDPRAIERRMRASVLYQFYGWLEHYLQQYKFLGRWGLMSTL